METAVTLQDRLTRVVVAPELGGSLVSWTTLKDKRALLRPAHLPATSPRQLGCYPLVPWSNRIAAGGFETPEGWMALPANTEGSPLAVHGTQWLPATIVSLIYCLSSYRKAVNALQF